MADRNFPEPTSKQRRAIMASLSQETPHSEITATIEVLDQLGLSRGDLKRLRSSAEVRHDVLRAFRKYPVITVSRTMSLLTMIDHGRYAWRNNAITEEAFPLMHLFDGDYETRLFDFPQVEVSTDTVLQTIVQADNGPWLLPRIEHLLAYGAGYPSEQSNGPIVALGSENYSGHYRVPTLEMSDFSGRMGRTLDLRPSRGSWVGGRWRFLAIRPIKK